LKELDGKMIADPNVLYRAMKRIKELEFQLEQYKRAFRTATRPEK
jgi:hypothetical protein